MGGQYHDAMFGLLQQFELAVGNVSTGSNDPPTRSVDDIGSSIMVIAEEADDLYARERLLSRAFSAVLDALDLETAGNDPENIVPLRDAALKRIEDIGDAIGSHDMHTAAETISRWRLNARRGAQLRARLNRLHSAVDAAMGDSDLPNDDSDLMQAMQEAAVALK